MLFARQLISVAPCRRPYARPPDGRGTVNLSSKGAVGLSPMSFFSGASFSPIILSVDSIRTGTIFIPASEVKVRSHSSNFLSRCRGDGRLRSVHKAG